MSVRADGSNKREVSALKSLKFGGRLAGLQLALDPSDQPILLKVTGSQEIYAIPLQIR